MNIIQWDWVLANLKLPFLCCATLIICVADVSPIRTTFVKSTPGPRSADILFVDIISPMFTFQLVLHLSISG